MPKRHAPSTQELRARLIAVLRASGPHLHPRDAFILVGFDYAARYLYPTEQRPGEFVRVPNFGHLDMVGVLSVVTSAPDISRAVGFGVPRPSGYGGALFQTYRAVEAWTESLMWDVKRSDAVEFQMHEIHEMGGLVPNVSNFDRTMVGVLADNTGEDFEPFVRVARNGEFAPGALGVGERAHQVLNWYRFLMPTAIGLPVFKWAKGGGFEIGRKELRPLVQQVAGQGKRRSKKTVLLSDAGEGFELSDPSKVACDAEVLAEFNRVRDIADEFPLLRDVVDRLLDQRDAEGAEQDLELADRLVARVGAEPDQAMVAAMLYCAGAGPRAALADLYDVSVDAIRHREERAGATLRELAVA